MKVTILQMPKGEGEPTVISELTEESPVFRPAYKRDLFRVEMISEDNIQIYVSQIK